MRQLLVYKRYPGLDRPTRMMGMAPVTERMPASRLEKLFLEAKSYAEAGKNHAVPFGDFWRQEIEIDRTGRLSEPQERPHGRSSLGNGDSGEVGEQGGVFLTSDPFRIVVKVTSDLKIARARHDLVSKLQGVLQLPPQLKPLELTLPSGRSKVYELIEFIPGPTYGGVFRRIDGRAYHDETGLRMVFAQSMLNNFGRFAAVTYDPLAGEGKLVRERYQGIVRDGLLHLTRSLDVPPPNGMTTSQMESMLERLVDLVPHVEDRQVSPRLDNSPENVIWHRDFNPLAEGTLWDRTLMDLCVLAHPPETAMERLAEDTYHIDLAVRKRALLAEDVAQAIIVHPTPHFDHVYAKGLECLGNIETTLGLPHGDLQGSLRFCTFLRALRKNTLLSGYVQQSSRHRSAGIIDSGEFNSRIEIFSLDCFKYVKMVMTAGEELARGREQKYVESADLLRHVYHAVMRQYGLGELFAHIRRCA